MLPAFGVLMVFYVSGGIGWNLLLRLLGNRLNPVRAQVVWGQPLLARYVPGSVLYVLARLVLAERAGIPRRITLASIVYEQALSAAAAVGVASYFLINRRPPGQPWLGRADRRSGGDRRPARGSSGRSRTECCTPSAANRCHDDPLWGILVMLFHFTFSWAICGIGIFFVARSVHDIGFNRPRSARRRRSVRRRPDHPGRSAGLGIRDAAFAWAVKAALQVKPRSGR
jgi:hypothetical protein